MTIEEQIKDTIYYQYAKDVLDGKIVTGKLIKLACNRFMNDCKRDDLIFNRTEVDRFINFCKMFRHFVTAEYDCLGNPFILEPWQQWCMANILGFYYKKTNKRRFNTAIFCMAKKNGKTAWAAAICLYFLFIEAGASVGLAANSLKQAEIAFKYTSKFASQIDPKGKYTKRYRRSIKSKSNDGDLVVFASDATKLDGINLSFGLIDEYHEAKDNSVYANMVSSMVSRPNPLMLVISTVGFNLMGPMKKMYDTDLEILEGLKQDDRRFMAYYQMDEGDDWEDEKNWIKHSPNLGVTVSTERLQQYRQSAKNLPSTLNETLTKNWNVWCSSSECWIPDHHILPCMITKFDINDFKDCECYMGVDLSASSDMTAVSYLLRKEDDDKFYFYTDYYLPSSSLVESPNRALYKYWVDTNQLHLINGNVIDYDFITKDIMQKYNLLNIRKISYDVYNATQWAIQCTEQGLPLEPYSQSIGNFNRPTKELERLIRLQNAVIDNNEITLWMFRNVDLKTDWNANIKPVKTDKNKKIDGVIAMIQALGGYLETPHHVGSLYFINS